MSEEPRLSIIKNWPYFRGLRPYGEWFSMSDTKEWAHVPIKGPCAAHRDGFDGHLMNCGCEEWKFVRRSPEQIAEIEALQKQVEREYFLQKAREVQQEIQEESRDGE